MGMKLKLATGFLLALLVAGAGVLIMSNQDNGHAFGGFGFPTEALSKDDQAALWERLKQEEAIFNKHMVSFCNSSMLGMVLFIPAFDPDRGRPVISSYYISFF